MPVTGHDVVVKNNVVYAGGGCSAVCNTVYAWDLSTNPPARQQASIGCNLLWSLAVDGNYLFAGGDCGDGHISIYDLTNPKAPVFLRDQGTGVSVSFTQLIPYGTSYLLGVSDSGGANGTDVTIIDRSNINNLVRIATLQIPNFVAFRGSVTGQTLYISGRDNGAGMAVVDLTHITTPTYTLSSGPAGTRGIATSGTYAIVGDGTAGISFFDIMNAAVPHFIATQKLAGMNWTVRAAGSKLYVAGEQQISVVDLGAFGGSSSMPAPVVTSTAPPPRAAAPPDITTLRVERGLISATADRGHVVIRGARGALTGPQPVSLEVRNATLGTTLPVVPVAADGSFTADITAAPEDHLVLAVISGDGERLEIDLGSHE
jgi:hypothetical protein